MQPTDVLLRRLSYEPDVRQERHHHEQTTLTLVFRGSLNEVVGSAHEEAGPLSVVFKPAGTDHANRIGPRGAATVQVELPPDFMDACPGGDEWSWAHGGSAARRFLALCADWSEAADSPGDLADRVFDVLAGFDEGPNGTTTAPPPWLDRIVEELEDTFVAPRSVRDLAMSATVHPVALARAHRRHFGCSITDRTRKRRVREAADLLGAPDESLSTVAFATGFSDQAHLTRVFKRETGTTPGRFRALLAS
jgi:AraC family transcriptional regulator